MEKPTRSHGTGWSEGVAWAYRCFGILLILLTLTPVHRLLQQPGTGRFGEAAALRAASNLEMTWWGIVLALGLATGLTILVPASTIRTWFGSVSKRLSLPSLTRYALAVGATAAGLALLAGLGLFKGLPTLVDGMVTRLQARAITGGSFAIELPEPMAAWLIPNTVLTPEGWVSQYPPFPALLLAMGELVGMPWLVFPLLVGATVTLTTLLAGRLLPDDGPVVRMGGILLALSPFLVILGGGYLSHVPAAAFVVLTLYAAVRALDGHWGWAVLVGAGSGAVVGSRPFLGLVVAVGLPVGLWVMRGLGARGWAWLLSRLALAAGGGAPFALLLGVYNRHFFGKPWRLGYSVAYGPAHDLGFHLDPWGNSYSPAEALGFTAVDLTGLGTYLLETPIPAVALVALFLVLKPRLPKGGGILLAWALLPALANFLYWHHGFHLGPRMLYEAAPAWILLVALAAAGLSRDGKDDGRFRFPDLVLWTLVVAAAGALLLVGNRVATYRWAPQTLARISPPVELGRGTLGEPPALVFVHGSWSERVSARLQASGMRLDSIETALRRNDICALHTYAMDRASGTATGPSAMDQGPSLDFQLLAETPTHLEPVYLTEGNRILVDRGRAVPAVCQREGEADRFGIISLAPLLWQGDLPGLERGKPIFVRDLGPEDNQRIIQAFPDRTPYLLLTPGPEAYPELLDYPAGMALIWGEEAS